MPRYFDNFKNNFSEGFDRNCAVDGLETFVKHLEKHFYSTVTVCNTSNNENFIELSLELHCNLSLVEMLFHFTKGNWGSFAYSHSTLSGLMNQFKQENDSNIDLEEFTLFFKDTTIIINKIYENSIIEQLHTILKQVGKHFVHFSKELTETPYEIFIPVFEECAKGNNLLYQNISSDRYSATDYLKFWGLYFDSATDGVIYDLGKNTIEEGDLFMLNQ